MAVRQGSARGSAALKPADTHSQDLLSLNPEDFRTQLALAAPLPTPTQLLGDHLSLPNRVVLSAVCQGVGGLCPDGGVSFSKVGGA